MSWLLVGFILWVMLTIWQHFDDKKAAHQAELRRQADEFFKPWNEKISNMYSSAQERSLREEVEKLSGNDYWKKDLFKQIDARVFELKEEETLETFRKRSGAPLSLPLLRQFIFRLPQEPGVYRIFNTQSGRSYIGESKNIRKRIFEHLDLLQEGKHKRSYGYRLEIQDEYCLHGPDVFGVDVLSTFNRNNVRQRHTAEARFIAQFDAVNHGYNHKHNESWTRSILDDAIKEMADGTIDPRRVTDAIEAASNFKNTKSQQRIIDEKLSELSISAPSSRSREILWTLEKIKAAALPFKTRNEFKQRNPKAYDAARRHNCMDEVCAHMGAPKNQNTKSKKSA